MHHAPLDAPTIHRQRPLARMKAIQPTDIGSRNGLGLLLGASRRPFARAATDRVRDPSPRPPRQPERQAPAQPETGGRVLWRTHDMPPVVIP